MKLHSVFKYLAIFSDISLKLSHSAFNYKLVRHEIPGLAKVTI